MRPDVYPDGAGVWHRTPDRRSFRENDASTTWETACGLSLPPNPNHEWTVAKPGAICLECLGPDYGSGPVAIRISREDLHMLQEALPKIQRDLDYYTKRGLPGPISLQLQGLLRSLNVI